jgi:hypothetical protein
MAPKWSHFRSRFYFPGRKAMFPFLFIENVQKDINDILVDFEFAGRVIKLGEDEYSAQSKNLEHPSIHKTFRLAVKEITKVYIERNSSADNVKA